jgi:hypothetical protein
MAKRSRGLDLLDRLEFERLEKARARAPMAGAAAAVAFLLSRKLDPESAWTDAWSHLQARHDAGDELTVDEGKTFHKYADLATALAKQKPSRDVLLRADRINANFAMGGVPLPTDRGGA